MVLTSQAEAMMASVLSAVERTLPAAVLTTSMRRPVSLRNFSTVALMRSIAAETVSPFVSASLTEAREVSERSRMLPATTAKPLPASPARAASTEALMDRRLMVSAMFWTLWVIFS